MMDSDQRSRSCEAQPMNGGDGIYSYSQNSLWQRRVGDIAKGLIRTSIAEKLDVENFSSSKTFRMADLGCSVGPNTFFAVQNIIEALQQKYTTRQGHHFQLPEFQVFFNDLTSNDFNTLFASLPPERQYYAAAVPGSFYGRLFPKASLHFVYSSICLHWRSRVPDEVLDKSSPAWNKGRILYSNSAKKVVDAYQAKYEEDMEIFLHARAEEVVCGGLVAFVVPGRPDGIPHSQLIPCMAFELLGSCLHHMAQKGLISEEKIDSFNIPLYYPSPQELIATVEMNGYFGIERMEEIPDTITVQSLVPSAQLLKSHMRAATEGLLAEHFGHEILEDLFELYQTKLGDLSSLRSGKAVNLFVLLKRKRCD